LRSNGLQSELLTPPLNKRNKHTFKQNAVELTLRLPDTANRSLESVTCSSTGSVVVTGHEGSSELKWYLLREVGEAHMFDIHSRWLVVDDVGRET